MAQTGTQIVSLEGMTQEEKLEKIQSMKPGTLLVMKNHVVMYIGQENGEDLILHNLQHVWPRMVSAQKRSTSVRLHS